MKSPEHKKNILQVIFTHCGVGIVQAPNGMYTITQVFATRPAPVNVKTLPADVIKTSTSKTSATTPMWRRIPDRRDATIENPTPANAERAKQATTATRSGLEALNMGRR